MNERGLLVELGMAAMALLDDAAKLRWLDEQGVSLKTLAERAGPLGTARIYPDTPQKGLFEYADCGHGDDGSVDVVIQGMFFRDCHGRLDDLIAWNPRQPENWWLRIGGPQSWIGAAALHDAGFPDWDEFQEGRPQPGLRLYPHPLAWLVADAPPDGAVLLDAGGLLWRDHLGGIVKVIVPDEQFATHVYKQIRKRPPTFKLPEVWVDKQQSDEAAA